MDISNVKNEIATQTPNDYISGDISQQDIVIPHLLLTQALSELRDLFPVGSYTLGDEFLLVEKEKPLRLTVVQAKKFYEELLAPGDEELPQRWNTMADMVEAGFTAQWPDATAGPVAKFLIIIDATTKETKAPFPFEFNGANYAVAQWTLRKTGYGAAARKIFTALTTSKSVPATMKWELKSLERKGKKGTFFVPNINKVGENDPEFVKWACGQVGGEQ